jgi:hypothetical protein
MHWDVHCRIAAHVLVATMVQLCYPILRWLLIGDAPHGSAVAALQLARQAM